MTNLNNTSAATIVVLTSSAHVELYPEFTVEAEYGSVVIEGSKGTLAHHTGSWKECSPPCLGDNFISGAKDRDLIQVSHFDLDTLGGVARIMGWKDIEPMCPCPGDCRESHELGFCQEECLGNNPDEDLFWKIAAAVDLRGPHKVEEIRKDLLKKALRGLTAEEMDHEVYCFDEEWREALNSLQAFWAWSEGHKLFAPRDGALDVTSFFKEAWTVLERIFEDDKALLKAGEKWLKKKEELNKKSFLSLEGGVILRKASAFVNHLYETPEGEIGKAVVAFNENHKSVTVSLADPVKGVNIARLLQSLWGPEAGGHATIGGSPRGTKMAFKDAVEAAEAIRAVFK